MPLDWLGIKCLVSSGTRGAVKLQADSILGMYEFVKKGDPPVVGITKLDGITMAELKRPRRAIPLPMGTEAETVSTTVSASTSPAA